MIETFEHLEPLLKTFWFVAIPASLVFIIQTVLTFTGLDSGDGMETDLDSGMDSHDTPFHVFTIRNLINFMLGFSWTGISCYQSIESKPFLIILSLVVGVVFVYLFFVIIRQIQKLAEDNSFRLSSTLQKTAEVYLTIPGAKTGKGKVMVSVKGTFHELDAITEGATIPSNTLVRITGIDSGNLLIVETI